MYVAQPHRLLAALHSCMQNRKPTLLIASKDPNSNHEAFVPSYSKVFMQTAWKALRLWRLPARCYRSLSASWSSSVQLASHRTLCIDQQRACLRSSALQSELPLASFPTLAHSKFIFLKPNLHMFYIFAFTLELARLAVCAVTCHTESQNHSKYPEILIPEILIIVYTGESYIWLQRV